jgi:hypothetical protein
MDSQFVPLVAFGHEDEASSLAEPCEQLTEEASSFQDASPLIKALEDHFERYYDIVNARRDNLELALCPRRIRDV